ncbi:hypothetical protein HZS_7035 [Henneguya salminicola]|nr:hypothetical protein HZS_7035 [Henneguya salminicola]
MCKCEKIKIHDEENEIKEYLVNGSNDLPKYSNQIFQALICFIKEKYKAIQIPSRNEVYNRIKYLRGPYTEAILAVKIQTHHSTIPGRLFLQRSWAGNIDGEFQRILMWSSDEDLTILWMGRELFIDATFRVTPHPFVQCLIVCAFPPTNFFVLCAWALMSRRNEYLYCQLFHAIIFQLKYVWSPKSVNEKDGIPDDEAQIALNMMCSLPSIEDDQINGKLEKIQNL